MSEILIRHKKLKRVAGPGGIRLVCSHQLEEVSNLLKLALLSVLIIFTLTSAPSVAARPHTLCFDTRGQPVTEKSAIHHCVEALLPDNAKLEWSALISTMPGTLGNEIYATGSMKKHQFSPSTIARTASTTADPIGALPINLPLLDKLTAQAFGKEERVTVMRLPDNTLSIHCRDGNQPAGVTLSSMDGRFPEGAKGILALLGQADLGFKWGIAPQGRDARLLEQIVPSQSREFSSHISLDRIRSVISNERSSVVILCPQQSATLITRGIELHPEQSTSTDLRSAWVWNATLWRENPDQLLVDAAAVSVQRLYIALSIAPEGERIEDDAALSRFVARASNAGIAVWAVEGDPGMAGPNGRRHALLRQIAIRRYQASVSSTARLAGIQYDIEPYLLPEYAKQPDWVAKEWTQTVRVLSEGGELELDFVLPFWLPQSPLAKTVLDEIRQAASSITIMAYRTASDDIQKAAEPLLAWGIKHTVPVHIALEAGPLPDEMTQYYMAVQQGLPAELWLVPKSDRTLALRLDQPSLLAQGVGYKETRQQIAPANRVSFLGDHARMLRVSDQLQTAFSAWSSYAGMAFHGLLE